MSLSISSQTHFRMPISPLQILLLIQLESEPKYGYEMLKTLKDEFQDTWTPKTGTVYPALKSLEKKGLVTTITREDTDFYEITERGRQIFQLLEIHMEESIDFSLKYISVIFKWMSQEMKEGALSLLQRLSEKEAKLTRSLFTNFEHNTDNEMKDTFLQQIRNISQNRLNLINQLIGDEETQ